MDSLDESKKVVHCLLPKLPPIPPALPLNISPADPSITKQAVVEPAAKIAPALPSPHNPVAGKNVSMANNFNLPYQAGVLDGSFVFPNRGPVLGYPPPLGRGGSRKQRRKQRESMSSIGQIAGTNGNTTPYTPHFANGAPNSDLHSAIPGGGTTAYYSPQNERFTGSKQGGSMSSIGQIAGMNGNTAPYTPHFASGAPNSDLHSGIPGGGPHYPPQNGNFAGDPYYQPPVPSSGSGSMPPFGRFDNNQSGIDHSGSTGVAFGIPSNNFYCPYPYTPYPYTNVGRGSSVPFKAQATSNNVYHPPGLTQCTSVSYETPTHNGILHNQFSQPDSGSIAPSGGYINAVHQPNHSRMAGVSFPTNNAFPYHEYPGAMNGNNTLGGLQFDLGNTYYQPGVPSVTHHQSGHVKDTSVSFVTPANNGDMQSSFPPVVLNLNSTPAAPQANPGTMYTQPAVLPDGSLATRAFKPTPAMKTFAPASTGPRAPPSNMYLYPQSAVARVNVAPVTPKIEPTSKAVALAKSVSFSSPSHLVFESKRRPSPYSLTFNPLQLMQRDLRALRDDGHKDKDVERIWNYIHNTWNTMIELNNKMFNERTRCRRCNQCPRAEHTLLEMNHGLSRKATNMWRDLQKELSDTNPLDITMEGMEKFYDKYWDIERIFWEDDEAAGCGVPTWTGFHHNVV